MLSLLSYYYHIIILKLLYIFCISTCCLIYQVVNRNVWDFQDIQVETSQKALLGNVERQMLWICRDFGGRAALEWTCLQPELPRKYIAVVGSCALLWILDTDSMTHFRSETTTWSNFARDHIFHSIPWRWDKTKFTTTGNALTATTCFRTGVVSGATFSFDSGA